jgi:hypothetical protein
MYFVDGDEEVRQDWMSGDALFLVNLTWKHSRNSRRFDYQLLKHQQ